MGEMFPSLLSLFGCGDPLLSAWSARRAARRAPAPAARALGDPVDAPRCAPGRGTAGCRARACSTTRKPCSATSRRSSCRPPRPPSGSRRGPFRTNVALHVLVDKDVWRPPTEDVALDPTRGVWGAPDGVVQLHIEGDREEAAGGAVRRRAVAVAARGAGLGLAVLGGPAGDRRAVRRVRARRGGRGRVRALGPARAVDGRARRGAWSRCGRARRGAARSLRGGARDPRGPPRHVRGPRPRRPRPLSRESADRARTPTRRSRRPSCAPGARGIASTIGTRSPGCRPSPAP